MTQVRSALVYVSFTGFDEGYALELMDSAARWQQLFTDSRANARDLALLFLFEELTRWEDQPCLLL